MKKGTKSRKLFVSLALAIAMAATCCCCAFSLTACSNNPDIGVCLTTTSDTLNVSIGNAVTEKFEAEGLKVSVQSADSDVTTQRNQIDAFITQGVQMIVVCPTEINALADTLNKARDKGIKVVISGASTNLDCYDALSASDEFLVGSYIALLAKKWIDEKVEDGTLPDNFEVCICGSSLNMDAYKRTNGMKTIYEPYLIRYEMEKDSDGNETDNLATDSSGNFIKYYCDADGNKVDDSHKVNNPAYCEHVSESNTWEKEMTLDISSGTDFMSQVMTQHANTRVCLCYMSGFAPTMSQYIIDNSTYKNEEFGIFSGGVSGSEPSYLLGSIPSAVEDGATLVHSDTTYKAVESIFRGASAFGGTDAALAVADLAYNVYFGEEGVDYSKRTAEAIGVWYSVVGDATTPDTLAVMAVTRPEGSCVEDFDPVGALSYSNTEIKWQKK